MRKRMLWLLTVVAVLLAPTLLSAQDWAGKGRAQGMIRDENGDPIEGARVVLRPMNDPTNGPEPIFTNKKGRWSVLGLQGGLWKVLIDAEGFKPSEGTYGVNEFQAAQPAVVTLVRDSLSSISKGDELLDAGDFAGARSEYQKAASGLDEAGAARLRSRIGDTYLEEGNYPAARAEYEKALPYIELEEQAHIRLQLATSFEREGRSADARAEYEKVIPLLTPEGQAQVLLTMARGYDHEGRRDDAISTLERALALQPDTPELLQLIADLLGRAGRDEEAREYLARMPEDAQLPPDMILNVGIRLYNEGDTAQALTYFDRAVKENPDLAETYYYRGLVYLSQGENDRAKADFERLLKLEPGNSHADEVKEFLKFLTGE